MVRSASKMHKKIQKTIRNPKPWRWPGNRPLSSETRETFPSGGCSLRRPRSPRNCVPACGLLGWEVGGPCFWQRKHGMFGAGAVQSPWRTSAVSDTWLPGLIGWNPSRGGESVEIYLDCNSKGEVFQAVNHYSIPPLIPLPARHPAWGFFQSAKHRAEQKQHAAGGLNEFVRAIGGAGASVKLFETGMPNSI